MSHKKDMAEPDLYLVLSQNSGTGFGQKFKSSIANEDSICSPNKKAVVMAELNNRQPARSALVSI